MKINIVILFICISLYSFSQSIGELKIGNGISKNPLQIEFSVYETDTVDMNIYDTWGNKVLQILPKDEYEKGTYKIEYTLAESVGTEDYIYQLKSSNKQLFGSIMFVDFVGSLKTTDYVKITHVDSIKVFDTTHVTHTDTINVLIIDTLHCVKTSTKLHNYQSFSISESRMLHNQLFDDFSDAETIMLFDITGKFIRNISITSDIVDLQDIAPGIYIGIVYGGGEILQTIRLIQE